MSGPKTFPMPPDLAERAKHMTRAELCAHYGASDSQIDRRLHQLGIKAKKHPTSHRLVLPENYREQLRTMTNAQLELEWGVVERTIQYIRAAEGIRSPGHVAPVRGQARIARMSVSATVPSETADLAARHLQRKGYVPVCRMTVFNTRGVRHERDTWMVGRVEMATSEMVDLAKRKGFDPDEWRVLAA